MPYLSNFNLSKLFKIELSIRKDILDQHGQQAENLEKGLVYAEI